MGNSGTPTGTVAFRDGTTSIAGCSAVALSGGRATCTTSALAAGSHPITGAYSGDGTYGAGMAGPITETVNGTTTTTTSTGPATSSPGPGTLANIATRAQVLTGDNVMIAGFVIGGSASKTVAVIATGPSLAAYGIGNPLANPTLTLVRSSDQAVVATNDDWQSAANAAQLQASGFAPSDPRESGILVTLPPGAYTAIVSGAGGGTGIGVVAAYEVDHPEAPLANLSTRGQVLGGSGVMIGGFVIQGSAPRTVVITATGPSLAAYGIGNPLANPTLTVVRSSDQAVIATNDDWQSAANAAQIAASGFAPGNARESAVMLTLPPGAYTAIVDGVAGGTGVAVIAVYSVN
jgi:hypothetical protein